MRNMLSVCAVLLVIGADAFSFRKVATVVTGAFADCQCNSVSKKLGDAYVVTGNLLDLLPVDQKSNHPLFALNKAVEDAARAAERLDMKFPEKL